MDRIVIREKRYPIFVFWILTLWLFLMWANRSGCSFGDKCDIGLFLMILVCTFAAILVTWIYCYRPNRVIIDDNGVHIFLKRFSLSSSNSFWVHTYEHIDWANIAKVYVDWSEPIGKYLYDTSLIFANGSNQIIKVISLTSYTYSRRRLADYIPYFSNNNCAFDTETTNINSRKRLRFAFWSTILPTIIGILIALLLICIM